jgi:tetratricopeptide (TPR) repeat protein
VIDLRAFIAALVLAGASLLFGQAASTSDDAAMRALRQGNYAEALAQADQSLAQDPRNCRALTIRGLALKRTDKADLAVDSFKKASAICTDYLPALEGMAEIQYAKRSPDAAATLTKILALQPGSATSHAMLAVLDWQAGNCTDAVSHFVAAGDLVRSNQAAEIQYGSCLIAVADYKDAESLFKGMLDNQDVAGNRLRYAYACWKANDNDEAMSVLTPLVQGDTPDTRALTLAGRIAESRGDAPAAVQLIRRAIVSNPKDVQSYLVFADISFNLASFQVGVDMLNAGLTQLPQEGRLYLARGVLEVQEDKQDKAIEDFHRAHQLDPSLSFAQDALGMLLTQHHESSESLAFLSSQAKSHPDDALVQYLYAEALSESERASDAKATQDAVKAASRAVALEPDYQPARDLVCVLELRAGDAEAAMAQAKEALKRDPEDESAIFQELQAARRLGKTEDVKVLAVQLKQAHDRQEHAKTNYQLQEIADTNAAQ